MKTRPNSNFRLAALALLVTLGVALPAAACPNCREFLPNDPASSVTGGGVGGDGVAGDANVPPPPRMSATDAFPAAYQLGTSGNAAEGYYYAILLMLAVPYVIVACLGGSVFYMLRKNRLATAGQSAAATPGPGSQPASASRS